MSNLVSIEAALMGIIVVLSVCILWLLFSLRSLKKAQRSHASFTETTVAKLQRDVLALANQKEEDQARVVLITRHFKEIESAQKRLEEQLKEVKMQDPSMRLYQRAAELVKQGASIDDVMQACDLPRAEAELLMQVHRTK